MQISETWSEVARDEIADWNRRLLQTDASYRQYPYWTEPYRKAGYSLRYLVCGERQNPIAYVCVVTRALSRFKIGLVQCGPVSLSSQPLSAGALQGLAFWAMSQRYVFLRCTHSDADTLSALASAGRIEQVESYPFHRDPQNKLLVKQSDRDEEMLASFQPVARYEIRAAVRAGYEIRMSDQPGELEQVWPMFQGLAARKGFELSNRGLQDWIQVFHLAREQGCARLYTAWLDGDLIQSVFVLRYGSTAEYMLGALDIEKLKRRVSASCLIHWRAMRDFHEAGCDYYNLGGPGRVDQVFQFKRKFHPVLSSNPAPLTLVLNEKLYGVWSTMVLRTYLPWRSRARRVISRVMTPQIAGRLSAAK